MKILSFDIGIRNMAICCIEISSENQKVNVIQWDILNLIDTNTNIPVNCNQMNLPKSKKVSPTSCTKRAKYRKNENYYCDKHAKSSPFIIPTNETKLTYLKKQKLDALISIAHKQFIFENNNEKWKKDDYVREINKIYLNKCLEPIITTKKKAGDIDLIDIGKNMKLELDNYNYHNVDYVVIENQLSPLANRMKTIQGMLAQYFIMKYDNIDIYFVSSANKLKQFDPQNKNETEKKDKNIANPNYKENKKDGIFYTNKLIDNNEYFHIWKDKMSTRKKDDLADCFLQGLWFFKNRNIILYADDLKIKIV